MSELIFHHFLVSFLKDVLPPVTFPDKVSAMESWRISYGSIGGVKFETYHDDLIHVFNNGERVGSIRKIEHYIAPTHL